MTLFVQRLPEVCAGMHDAARTTNCITVTHGASPCHIYMAEIWHRQHPTWPLPAMNLYLLTRAWLACATPQPGHTVYTRATGPVLGLLKLRVCQIGLPWW